MFPIMMDVNKEACGHSWAAHGDTATSRQRGKPVCRQSQYKQRTELGEPQRNKVRALVIPCLDPTLLQVSPPYEMKKLLAVYASLS